MAFLDSVQKPNEETRQIAYAAAAIPARYALERGDWAAASQLALHPARANFNWSAFPEGEAVNAYARGLGARKAWRCSCGEGRDRAADRAAHGDGRRRKKITGSSRPTSRSMRSRPGSRGRKARTMSRFGSCNWPPIAKTRPRTHHDAGASACRCAKCSASCCSTSAASASAGRIRAVTAGGPQSLSQCLWRCAFGRTCRGS